MTEQRSNVSGEIAGGRVMVAEEEQRPGGERGEKERAEEAFDRIRELQKSECRLKVWAFGEVRLET